MGLMRPYIFLISLLIFSYSVIQVSYADSSFAAYKRGDYKSAFELYTQEAKQGISRAQYNLALMYGKGEGTPKDSTKKTFWLRKAAEQGEVKAQYNLALAYIRGEGVPKDLKKAYFWQRKAANQGDRNAQYNLGMMYGRGSGVQLNYEKAFYWLRRAAKQGDRNAQYGISVLYVNGNGVPQNIIKSYEWADIAFENGHNKAKQIIHSLEKQMTLSQLEQAKKISQNFKPVKEIPKASNSINSPTISKQQIANIQQNLKALGHFSGDIDGLSGPLTRSAIKSFQRNKKISVTGIIDYTLLEQINSMIELRTKEIRVSETPRAFSAIPPASWIRGPIKTRSTRLSLTSPPETPFAACSVSVKKIPALKNVPQATFNEGMVNDPPSIDEMASQLSGQYNNVRVFSSNSIFVSDFPAQLYKFRHGVGSPEGELWTYGIMVTTATTPGLMWGITCAGVGSSQEEAQRNYSYWQSELVLFSANIKIEP